MTSRVRAGEAGPAWRVIAASLRLPPSGNRRRACDEGLAIREHGLQDAPEWLAILDGFDRDRHCIPRRERLLAPAEGDHVWRRLGFCHPVNHLAVVTFDVDSQEAMRVGPEPLRDRAFDGDSLADVEDGVGVVGQ